MNQAILLALALACSATAFQIPIMVTSIYSSINNENISVTLVHDFSLRDEVAYSP